MPTAPSSMIPKAPGTAGSIVATLQLVSRRSHMARLCGSSRCKGQSMAWRSIADLMAAEGDVALLGAPMEAGSVTPGRCDLAPATIRGALTGFRTYNAEARADIGRAARGGS